MRRNVKRGIAALNNIFLYGDTSDTKIIDMILIMKKEGINMKKNKQTNNTQMDSFSNKKQTSKKNSSAQVSETNSDQDSSTSKYTVQQDNRERKDGPGGN